MKIINVLRGGLGNQLFQWATSKYLEIKYQCEVYQDIKEYEYLNSNSNITKRVFMLNNFPHLKYQTLNSYEQFNFKNNQIIELNESNFNPLEQNLVLSKLYRLYGYWQNYRFFEEIQNVIRKELEYSEETKKKLYEKFPEILTNCVSLHIRRTDYLTSNGFHPVQSISYFEESLKIIENYDNILIFSDDIEWCKNNLTFKTQIFIEGNSAIEDLWLMSLCKNNVISNSSFSWWGAWLNKNKNKKVIRPSKWYLTGDAPLMSPQNWIKI